MEIKEIRKLKQNMENSIKKIIRDFEAETSLSVTGINLSLNMCMGKKSEVYNVEVGIEL